GRGRRDGLDSVARDGKVDRVGLAGGGVGIEEGLAERAGAAVAGIGHGEAGQQRPALHPLQSRTEAHRGSRPPGAASAGGSPARSRVPWRGGAAHGRVRSGTMGIPGGWIPDSRIPTSKTLATSIAIASGYVP